jgi:hypothetical protein
LPAIDPEQTISAVVPPGFFKTLLNRQVFKMLSGTIAPYLSIISWVRQT